MKQFLQKINNVEPLSQRPFLNKNKERGVWSGSTLYAYMNFYKK